MSLSLKGLVKKVFLKMSVGVLVPFSSVALYDRLVGLVLILPTWVLGNLGAAGRHAGGGVASRRGNLPGVTDIFYKYFAKNVRCPCPVFLPRPLPLLLLPLPSGQSV
jgi:hypothetical protein